MPGIHRWNSILWKKYGTRRTDVAWLYVASSTHGPYIARVLHANSILRLERKFRARVCFTHQILYWRGRDICPYARSRTSPRRQMFLGKLTRLHVQYLDHLNLKLNEGTSLREGKGKTPPPCLGVLLVTQLKNPAAQQDNTFMHAILILQLLDYYTTNYKRLLLTSHPLNLNSYTHGKNPSLLILELRHSKLAELPYLAGGWCG